MVVVNVTAGNCQPQTIVIGRRGTYDTMQIAFDLSNLIEAYGNGVAVLAVKRSQDESAYPAVVTQEDNTLTWTVSETDTAYVGAGECQLMWYVDGGLAKTIIYPMVVMRDILQTAEEPPDGYENWIEHLTELGAETQQNAQDAAQSASEAKASEESAAESAKRAEDAAGLLVGVSATATTLDPGQPATAEYNDGVFEFGIPKGDKLTYADLTEADKEDLVQGPIKDAQDDAVEAVGTAKNNAVDAVNQAGTTQKNAVNQAGTTAVNAVGREGTTQVERVTTEGNTQVGRVQDKGDEVIASIPSDYSDLTAEVDDLTRQISDETTGLDTKAPVILDTASGAIASFSDGADSMPIRKLVAQIEPVQDLHGQSSPYPPGGGVNKFDKTTAVANERFSPSGIISYGGTSRSDYIPCSPNTEYYFLNVHGSSVMAGVFWFDANKQYLDYSDQPVASPTSYAATSPANAAYVGINFRTEDLDTVAVNYPSTVTTYSPYSNICPISGHTGAEIEQTGKNLLRLDDFVQRDGFSNLVQSFEDGTITVTNVSGGGRFACWNIPVIVGKRYMISFGELINCGAVYVNTSDNKPTAWLGYGTSIMNRQPYTPIKKWIQLTAEWNQAAGTTFFSVKDLQIEAGDFFTSYESPVSSSISVTFPETIYGGEDEVISGKLKSTMGKIVFDGTQSIMATNWQLKENSVAWCYYYDLTNHVFPVTLAGVPTFLASSCPVVSTGETIIGYHPQLLEVSCYNGSSSIGVIFRTTDMTLTTTSAINAYLAENPVTLVYELATPTTFTHDPQQIDTLYGTNNIWADTGDTSVEYCADTKLYVDNKITQAIANALNS